MKMTKSLVQRFTEELRLIHFQKGQLLQRILTQISNTHRIGQVSMIKKTFSVKRVLGKKALI